jgi:hypothetical protein
VIDTAQETAQDASITAGDSLVTALESSKVARKNLEDAKAVQAASKVKFSNEGSTVDGTRRLAELVGLIHTEGIDVTQSGLPSYITDNWPADPDELYADLFQMSVTEPAGLQTFDPDVAAFYQSPVGVKDAKLKKKVDAWIKANTVP